MELGTIREDGRVYSNAYDGKPRWLEKRVCENKDCKKEFLAASHRNQKFCGKTCQAHHKSVENCSTFCCATCGKDITRANSKMGLGKHGYNFCSRICKEKAQSVDGHIPELRLSHYLDGKTEYRVRALKAHGTNCMNCGYNDDDRMLDVHHVDGNRKNGRISNLKVLCVWCHALETRKSWPHFK